MQRQLRSKNAATAHERSSLQITTSTLDCTFCVTSFLLWMYIFVLDGSVDVHGYDVAHTNKVALVDTEGSIRAFYSGVDFGDDSDWDIDKVILDMEYLAR